MSRHFEAMRRALDAERALRARTAGISGGPRDGTPAKPTAPAEAGGAAPPAPAQRDRPAPPARTGTCPPVRATGGPRERGLAHKWFLKLPDGSVFGPVDSARLCEWAVEGRVIPTNQVSQDGHQWVPASSVPSLHAYWVNGTIEKEAGAASPTNVEVRRTAPEPDPGPPVERQAASREGSTSNAPGRGRTERRTARARPAAPDSSAASAKPPVLVRELQQIRNWQR